MGAVVPSRGGAGVRSLRMREIPDTLRELAEWVHGGRCTVHDLEFYEAFNQEYRPSHWTRNPESDDALGTFAQDGAGGQYALWFDAPGDGPRPVVKLGDDGDRVVLAVDALEFAWLVACGVEPIGVREGGAISSEEPPSTALQQWVQSQAPARVFAEPEAVITQAMAAYPTFADWMQQQLRA